MKAGEHSSQNNNNKITSFLTNINSVKLLIYKIDSTSADSAAIIGIYHTYILHARIQHVTMLIGHYDSYVLTHIGTMVR